MLDETTVLDTGAEHRSTEPSTERKRPPSPVYRLVHTVWFWPSALIAGLGVFQIGRPEMWQDELVTVRLALQSTPRLFELLDKVDAVHGLYYILMHYWVYVFGDSPESMRIPAALAMVGATACVALIGKRLFSHQAGLAGGLVFALLPMISRFAQEARSYGLVVFFVALATLLLLRALERPTVWRWAGYACAVTMILSLHIVAGTALAGHGLGLLLLWGRHRGWPELWRFAVAALAGVAAASPVMIVGLAQAGRQISWIQLTPLVEIWPQMIGSPKVALLVLALAVGAWLVDWRSAAVVTAFGAMPMLLVYLMSLDDLSYFFSKYLLFVLPSAAVLAGAGLTVLRRLPTPAWTKVLAPALGLIVLAIVAVPSQLAVRTEGFHSWYTFPQPRPTDMFHYSYSGAAKIVADGYQPGDGIVYGGRYTWWWYMHDVGVAYYLPAEIKMRDVFLAPAQLQPVDLYSVECPDAAACIGPEQRVWVVVPRELPDPMVLLTPGQAAALTATYDISTVKFATGMTVALLVRKAPALH